MTKKDALTVAIDTLTSMDDMNDVVETLQHMVDQLSVKRVTSDEVKEKRKEATAKARREMCDTVIPILREVITTDMTAKEIYEAAKDALPEGFSVAKVQNILIREMASELVRTDNGRNADTYRRV